MHLKELLIELLKLNVMFEFQEQYWRTLLFSEHFKFWKMQGYEFEEADELKMTSMLKEILMRQFAVS